MVYASCHVITNSCDLLRRPRVMVEVVDFVDANHFAYEDRAEEFASLILDWWNGGYQQV